MSKSVLIYFGGREGGGLGEHEVNFDTDPKNGSLLQKFTIHFK